MSLLCDIFGHKIGEGYSRGSKPYGTIKPSGVDGIGHEHARVFVVCDRCMEPFHVVNIHLPKAKSTTADKGNSTE